MGLLELVESFDEDQVVRDVGVNDVWQEGEVQSADIFLECKNSQLQAKKGRDHISSSRQ